MKVLDLILPRVYKLIKRNPRLAVILKAIWKLLPKIKAKLILLFRKKDSFCLPLDTYTFSQEWYQQMNNTHSNSLSMSHIHPAQIVQRGKVQTLDNDIYWKFKNSNEREVRENIVMSIPKARVVDDGFVVSPDATLLLDFSIVPDIPVKKHPLLCASKTLMPPKFLKGKVAVLTAHGGRGYYHWMFEVLPRLELIRKAGWNWNDIDKFIVNSQIARFQIETLQLLEIPRNKVVESHWNPHILTDQLIVPSIPEYVTPWVCDFLRKSFLKNPPKTPGKRRIYISRAKTTHRRVLNENKLMDVLSKYGFECIYLEEYPMAEQVQIMAEAAYIIAPHGAGLTNLVFCSPGTTIIELIYPKAVKRLFWTLSSIMNLNYYYLFAKGDLPPEGVDSYLNSDDMEIDLDKLDRLFKKLQLK